MKQIKKYLSFVLVILLTFTVFSGTSVGANNNDPALEATVTATDSTIFKPATGNAEGNLEINVTPTGVLTKDRGEIEVVFVVDTSGSMDFGSGKFYDGPRYCDGLYIFGKCIGSWKIKKEEYSRLEVAKDALESVTDTNGIFTVNKKTGDRYSLVSFASEATTIVSNKNNPVEIKNSLGNLKAVGATNYIAALTTAKSLFTKSENPKFIVFLTDGEPLMGSGRNQYRQDKDAIKRVLDGTNIKLYSIGFGIKDNKKVYNPDEDSFDLLTYISTPTGGKAVEGTTDNLELIYNEFGEEITNANLTNAKIKVKLPQSPGIVTPKNDPGVSVQNGYAIVDIAPNIPYKKGESTPTLPLKNLQLDFSAPGHYIFDDIKLVYNDIDGNEQIVDDIDSVGIDVVDLIAPTFSGEVKFEAPDNVSNLYIAKEGNNNKFKVLYNITPTGGIDSGELTNIKIKQQLPEGVSVNLTDSNSSVTIVEENGNNYAIISFSETIKYQQSNSNNNQTNKTVFMELTPLKTNSVNTEFSSPIALTVQQPGAPGGQDNKWHLKFADNPPQGLFVEFSDGSIMKVDKKNMNNLDLQPIRLLKGSIEDSNQNGPNIFAPDKLTATLSLQADYAVNTILPNPMVHFNATGFTNTLSSQLNAPTQTIINVVKLTGGKYSLIGYYDGKIQIITNETGGVKEKYGQTGRLDIYKAIKSLDFVTNTNERYVKVQYGDNTFGIVNLYEVGLSLKDASYNLKIGEEIKNAIQINTYPIEFNPSDIIIVVVDPAIAKVDPENGGTKQRDLIGKKQGMTEIYAIFKYKDYDISETGTLIEDPMTKKARAIVKVSGETSKPDGKTDKDW